MGRFGSFFQFGSIFIIPLVWLLVFTAVDGDSHAIRCLYVAGIMASYWACSSLPLAIVSLIPIVLFPLLGIASTGTIVKEYTTNVTMMFMGGLIVALAVESSGLHKRIALKLILLIGTSHKTIILSFMISTCILSMWISNTASTAMMLPLVEAVIQTLKKVEGSKTSGPMRGIFLLSIAYSANIGGTGVITGTPPNLLVLSQLPEDSGLNFASWMFFAVPLMIVNLILAWLYLMLVTKIWTWRKFRKDSIGDSNEVEMSGEEQEKDEESEANLKTDNIRDIIQEDYNKLGRISYFEIIISILFGGLVFLWFFQKPRFITGWADLAETEDLDGTKTSISAATPAILVVIILFVLPKENPITCIKEGRPVPTLITWQLIQEKLPWSVVLLLGGGIALSKGFRLSGLSDWMVDHLKALKGLKIEVINLCMSLLTASITEFMSNTATASVLLPILKDLSVSLCENPVYLILSCVISCSYAFMLPVATAPNAIVFAQAGDDLPLNVMLMTGFPLNIIGVMSTFAAINSYGGLLFEFDKFPEWAADYMGKNVSLNCPST